MAGRAVTSGHVNARGEAVLPLTVHGPTDLRAAVRFVLDTGFNGHLSMPDKMIRELGLDWFEKSDATLADGSRVSFDVYLATVFWFGKPRRVKVDAMDSPPTLGTELLLGHTLNVLWVPGGQVTIETLATS